MSKPREYLFLPQILRTLHDVSVIICSLVPSNSIWKALFLSEVTERLHPVKKKKLT
jgi:hypothetical protein